MRSIKEIEQDIDRDGKNDIIFIELLMDIRELLKKGLK